VPHASPHQKEHEALSRALRDRFYSLQEHLKPRELLSIREGVKGRGTWTHPELLCATTGTTLNLRLAVADFKAILAQIDKL
jgi:hypothetical protein